MSLDDIDQRLIDRFRDEVRRDESLFKHLGEVSEMFHRRRDEYPEGMVQRRNKLIGELRGRLSHVCVDALQPDLIIMDEFQRFPELLHGDDESARLARELFNYHDHQNAVRTLLLSATPYRMLTLNGDDETDGDHYKDFFETLTFLFGQQRGREIANTLDQEMRKFRSALHGLPSTYADASACKTNVEFMLRQVMCRTERVSSTAARDSMVCKPFTPVTVLAGDLRQAIQVAAIARALDAPDVIEYWKSAPYLLNFMREYKLKRAIKERQGSKAPVALVDLISRAKSACLSRARLNAYRPIEPANGRMRALMDDVFKDGLEQNLWVPPSLPYYGAAPTSRFTKALVFSSWSMVPEAIAATLSYEAERRMGAASMRRGYFSKTRTRPLQFRKEQGRLTGMRAMLLIYPSPTLAKLADPLLVMTSQPEILSYADMRHAIAERLTKLFQKVRNTSVGEADGSAWEWAMPAAIDGYVRSGVVNWLGASDGMVALAGEDAFREHVLELQAAASPEHHGPVSDDILDLLVDLALGSPAICALRALHRIAPDLAWDDHRLLSAASKVAWGFRALFNQHEAVALLRREENDVYWRRALIFSAEHNLQAVLDEYAHFLVESEGLGSAEQGNKIQSFAKLPRHDGVSHRTLLEVPCQCRRKGFRTLKRCLSSRQCFPLAGLLAAPVPR
jgi:hypothetical protein